MFLGWVRSNQTARLSVRITPRHEKRPTFAGRIHRSDIRSVAESFSRPMTGHTPQKLPLSPEQSPASSHLRAPLAIRAPLYTNTRSRECQALFFNFSHKISVSAATLYQYSIPPRFLDFPGTAKPPPWPPHAPKQRHKWRLSRFFTVRSPSSRQKLCSAPLDFIVLTW